MGIGEALEIYVAWLGDGDDLGAVRQLFGKSGVATAAATATDHGECDGGTQEGSQSDARDESHRGGGRITPPAWGRQR